MIVLAVGVACEAKGARERNYEDGRTVKGIDVSLGGEEGECCEREEADTEKTEKSPESPV